MATTRSPRRPRITTCASTAAHTAERSSDGSAWHSAPPIVPRLRTTRVGDDALGVGEDREAPREQRATRGGPRWRVIAPMRTSSPSRADVAELVGERRRCRRGTPASRAAASSSAAACARRPAGGPRGRAPRAARARPRRWWHVVLERCGDLHVPPLPFAGTVRAPHATSPRTRAGRTSAVKRCG